MLTSYHSLVYSIYTEASKLNKDERKSFIENECGVNTEIRLYVETLLNIEIDEADNFLDSITSILGHLDQARVREAGEHIGEYKILECLSHSNMSYVYLAERQKVDFTQKVVIKLLRLADYTRARESFQNETSLQAKLNHPYIAQLIDASYDETNTPYIVMEFVDGLTIDEYCKVNKLTSKQRIELLIKVCDGLEYAHNHLVSHNDIKPQNILVTKDSHPKIVDFGLSQITDQEKQHKSAALTPAYCSPEQALNLEPNAISDVYSFTLLLYKLIHKKELFTYAQQPDKQQLIRDRQELFNKETPILIPIRNFRNKEISSIIEKGLQYSPPLRYQSIYAIRSDLQALIDKKPISTLNKDWKYLTYKYLVNNVIVVSAAVIIAAVSVLTTYLVDQHRDEAVASQQQALEQRNSAQAISDYLLETYENAALLSPNYEARKLFDLSIEKLESTDKINDSILVDIYNKVAQVFLAYDDYKRAEDISHKALAIINENQLADSKLINTIYILIQALYQSEQFIALNQQIEKLKEIPIDKHLDATTKFKQLMAYAYSRIYTQENNDSEELYKQIFAIIDAYNIDKLDQYHAHSLYARSKRDLGDILATREQLAIAHRLVAEEYGKESIIYLDSLVQILLHNRSTDNYAANEALINEGIQLVEKRIQSKSSSAYILQEFYIDYLLWSGKQKEAINKHEKLCADVINYIHNDNTTSAFCYYSLGNVYINTDNSNKAISTIRKALSELGKNDDYVSTPQGQTILDVFNLSLAQAYRKNSQPNKTINLLSPAINLVKIDLDEQLSRRRAIEHTIALMLIDHTQAKPHYQTLRQYYTSSDNTYTNGELLFFYELEVTLAIQENDYTKINSIIEQALTLSNEQYGDKHHVTKKWNTLMKQHRQS